MNITSAQKKLLYIAASITCIYCVKDYKRHCYEWTYGISWYSPRKPLVPSLI